MDANLEKDCGTSDGGIPNKSVQTSQYGLPVIRLLQRQKMFDIFAYPDIRIYMQKTAQLFKAMSEETRLRILALLGRGELCVCEIEAALDMPQSTVSRHLALLRQAGLVLGRRRGVWMHYRLAEAETEAYRCVLRFIEKHLGGLDPAGEDAARLEDYLQNTDCCSRSGSCGTQI
jgi:ArsR family transcriptional regulator